MTKRRTGSQTKTKIAKVISFANGVRALDMRRDTNLSWEEIAEIIGAPDGTAALNLAKAARLKLAQEQEEDLRYIHHERYEFMYQSLLPKIGQGRERAIEVAVKVLESDATLMGINKDGKAQSTDHQPIVIQILPHPGDTRAKQLAKDAIIDSKSQLLLPPDSGV